MKVKKMEVATSGFEPAPNFLQQKKMRPLTTEPCDNR